MKTSIFWFFFVCITSIQFVFFHNSIGQEYRVVDLKGKVYINDVLLVVDTVIVITDPIKDLDKLQFSAGHDFVRIENVKTKKAKTLYASRPGECIGCLGSRGMYEIDSDNDFISYFSRPLLVFSADTIITHRANSFRTDNDEVYVWVFYIPSVKKEPFLSYAGQNDTLFILHEMMFLELDDELKQFASFYMENLQLAKYNTKNDTIVYFRDMSEITIYFFEDVIRFLYSTGMTDEEVYQEICTNYINDKGVLYRNNLLNNSKEAEMWLKKVIFEAKL